MRKVDAAIFDSDGTLLDTREYIYTAFEHSLRTHNLPIASRDIIARQIGKPLANCYEALAPKGDIELLCTTHHNYQVNNLQLVDSYEGIILTLETLKQNGIQIGIFSSRRAATLTATLKHVGVYELCDAVVCPDDIEKQKPDPEGVFMVLKMLDVEAERSVMIGDAVHDISCGKSAGVALTIGITHGFGTRDALENAGADFVVDRIPDIIPLLVDEKHLL